MLAWNLDMRDITCRHNFEMDDIDQTGSTRHTSCEGEPGLDVGQASAGGQTEIKITSHPPEEGACDVQGSTPDNTMVRWDT